MLFMVSCVFGEIAVHEGMIDSFIQIWKRKKKRKRMIKIEENDNVDKRLQRTDASTQLDLVWVCVHLDMNMYSNT